jgi:hypothetical protein
MPRQADADIIPYDVQEVAEKALARKRTEVRLLEIVVACNNVIRQYQETGISGTVPDIEHHQIREEALTRLRAMQELPK